MALAAALLAAGAALAARSPDPERAALLVSELVAASSSGALTPEQLGRWLVPRALAPMPEARRVAWYEATAQRLAPGGELGRQLVAGGAVAGVVEGPGYVRVVLRGPPWLSFVVVRDGAGPVIERVETSGCGLCGEPERFVVDLLRDVADPKRAPQRLLAGVDLVVDAAALSGVDVGEWGRALDRRDAHAGYLRWLLAGAHVVGTQGDEVTVALARGAEPVTETWTVRWQGERWALDYGALPEDSPLRLDLTDLDVWRSPESVAQASAAWWLPTWRGREPLLIASGVIYAAPRRGRGELVIYTQDLGRSAALLIRLDAETGAVLASYSLPRLSIQLQVAPYQWRALFRVALSPDGELLAVAVHNQLQVVAVETGELRYTGYDLLRGGALAWSPGGGWLAACDGGGAVELLEVGAAYAVRGRAAVGAACVGLAWRGEETVTAVTRLGALHVLSAPSLTPVAAVTPTCCGEAVSAVQSPGSGEVLVGCGDTCAPVWLWRSPPPWDQDPPQAMADERMVAPEGVIAEDSSGRWLVTPHSGQGGAAALVDAASGEPLARFAAAPLVQVAWDGDALYGVDTAGDLWRWSTEALLSHPY